MNQLLSSFASNTTHTTATQFKSSKSPDHIDILVLPVNDGYSSRDWKQHKSDTTSIIYLWHCFGPYIRGIKWLKLAFWILWLLYFPQKPNHLHPSPEKKVGEEEKEEYRLALSAIWLYWIKLLQQAIPNFRTILYITFYRGWTQCLGEKRQDFHTVSS